MIYNCVTCGTVWTPKNSTAKINPVKMPKQTCPDCVGFDWPVYTKRVADAAKSLGKPAKAVPTKK